MSWEFHPFLGFLAPIDLDFDTLPSDGSGEPILSDKLKWRQSIETDARLVGSSDITSPTSLAESANQAESGFFRHTEHFCKVDWSGVWTKEDVVPIWFGAWISMPCGEYRVRGAIEPIIRSCADNETVSFVRCVEVGRGEAG
jgi:hypothetical protein